MNCTTRRETLFHTLRAALLAALALAGASVQAQNGAPAAQAPLANQAVSLTPEGLTSCYPSGSIQSTATANQALADATQLRAALDQKLAVEQRDCYAKFFATSCVDAAKERHRLALAQIRKIEVEADTFNRNARVVERDKNLAEKRANDAINHPKPLTDSATVTPSGTQPPLPHPQGERIAEHEAKMRQLQNESNQDAQKRADNVAAYDKKVQDAEARQRDVAAKKADKAAKAAAKAAAADKAPAATATAAGSAAPAAASATAASKP